MELLFTPISRLKERLERGDCSAVELTTAYLAQIESTESMLKSFLHLDAEGALARAAEIDRRRQAGAPSRLLEGIPVGIKDVLVTDNMPTTCASRVLEGFRPPYTATAVKRLIEHGAVIIGKLNSDEFAMGSSTENSGYQLTHNPWNPEYSPGGSSGGSAASVAASQVVVSLGTDTGGSIRQPASFCGVVGLKPTYGRVSRYGLVAFASSLDQIGPLGRSAEDCALMLQAIAGHDPADSTSVDRAVPDYVAALQGDVTGMRIGVPEEYWGGGLDPEVAARLDEVREILADRGAELAELSLPHTEYAVATYYLVATAEASSNLARYDGVRYGVRKKPEQHSTLLEMYKETRHDGFGPEVKRRIMLGTYALSAGYYDAYYLKALKVRTLIRRDFERAFQQCDVVMTPTVPVPAFRLGEMLDDPLQMYLTDIFTVTANLAGIPGISIPCGSTAGGLPVGVQFLGPAFEEDRLLRVAHAYQQVTDFHTRTPF